MTAGDWIDLAANLLILIGAPLGAGYKVIWQDWILASKRRLNTPKPQIDLDLETHRLFGDQILVEITIRVSNSGQVPIIVGPDSFSQSNCSVQTVQNADSGQVDFGKILVESDHYLMGIERYTSSNDVAVANAREIIEPGTFETYRVIFSTNYVGPIWVHLEFADDSGYRSRLDEIVEIRAPT